jgi:hypothetical protein
MKTGMPILALMLVSTLVTGSAHARNEGCSIKQDDQASDGLEKAASLLDLYKVSKLFPGCFEGGGTAEEASDDIVVRLSHHWSRSLGELQRHAADRAFTLFVLRHIDATTDSDDLKVISTNARAACPRRASAVCQKVAAAAESALREQRRFGVALSLPSSAAAVPASAAAAHSSE